MSEINDSNSYDPFEALAWMRDAGHVNSVLFARVGSNAGDWAVDIEAATVAARSSPQRYVARSIALRGLAPSRGPNGPS